MLIYNGFRKFIILQHYIMSLISHVKQKIEDKTNVVETINILHQKLEELRSKVEKESDNKNIDTSLFATKEDLEDIIKDLKDCFNDIIEITPRNNTEIVDLKNNVANLEKANKQFEERLHHIEALSKNFEEPHIEHTVEKGSSIRIPKIKIEKTKNKI